MVSLITGFKIGDRVELSPATDWWMRGARYGTVAIIGRKWVTVQLDHGITLARPKLIRIAPSLIDRI
jgi:hypothetical protein